MIPSVVSETMERLCTALESKAPGLVESVYVYGSTALGAYIEGASDIDFIAVVRRAPDAGDLRAIAEAHDELKSGMPGTDIMGAYLLPEQLGKIDAEAGPVPTYFEGSLHTDGKGGDLNPVTWWILKRYGLRVYGKNVSFDFETPVEALIDYVIGNMNSYWAGWITRLDEMSGQSERLRNVSAETADFAVEWCVLGMLRQWFTIRERDVTSKQGAGEYGLPLVPERYRGLIREALAIRRRTPDRVYESQEERLYDLIQLLRYIHAECNRSVQRLV